VVDADNILLGQAERTVTISVSDQDVKQAPRSKAASEKMQQAKQRFDEDQLDEAIDLAAAAATLDPKNIEAQQLGHRWDGERQTVRQQLDRVKDALQRDNLDEAQKALDAAKQLHPSYPPVRDAERQIADQRKLASTHATATTPYVRIEACVDGSEWIRIENSRLSHQHRTLSQIGEHVDCRLPHRIAGGGFLVDGQVITLGRLPLPIRISNIDHFEVERGRGSVRMVGSKRILINDDAPGADLYIIRLYQGSAAPAAPVAGSPIAPPEATSPVVVTAKADKVTINLGEQTWVRAEATGGTPPYTYQWTGGLTGSWQAVDLQGERAGDTIAMVPVRDSRGRTGSAQVMVEVRADDNQVAKADKINALLSKAHALSASPGESLLTVLL